MSTGRFTDRVLFITGAGSGLARATAKLFAAEGAKVFAVDVDPDGLAATILAIRLAGRHRPPRLRRALRRLEGGARQLHALDRARVREPRAARQLPRAGGDHVPVREELHPAPRLRAVAGRVLLAARAAPDVEARGHGQDDRVPRLGRGADDHGGDAGRGLGDARLVAGLLAALERAVAVRGTHPFILHTGRRVTYAEFDRFANRAAHVLRGLGVGKGDRVTLAM